MFDDKEQELIHKALDEWRTMIPPHLLLDLSKLKIWMDEREELLKYRQTILDKIQYDENLKLREYLAIACTDSILYLDDGELQDNSEFPFIDYKRDSIETILNKKNIRFNNQLKFKL